MYTNLPSRIWFQPIDSAGLIVVPEHWVADNMVESAVWRTRAEAIEFAYQHWGSPVFEVTVTEQFVGIKVA